MFSIQTSTKLTIGQTIGQAIGWFIQSLEPGDGANSHRPLLTNGPVLVAKEIGMSKMLAMTGFQKFALCGHEASANGVNCPRKSHKWDS